MNSVIDEKVSVITLFDKIKGTVVPKKLKWQGREYLITKLTYHHKIREGRTTFHIFHVTDGDLDFRLRLDTENLHWILEEVCDDAIN